MVGTEPKMDGVQNGTLETCLTTVEADDVDENGRAWEPLTQFRGCA